MFLNSMLISNIANAGHLDYVVSTSDVRITKDSLKLSLTYG